MEKTWKLTVLVHDHYDEEQEPLDQRMILKEADRLLNKGEFADVEVLDAVEWDD